MSSPRSQQLLALIGELLEEAEKEVDGELDERTPLIQSGLLDSLSLLSVAEWVSDQLREPLDLTEVDMRNEWDTVAGILAFVDRREPSP